MESLRKEEIFQKKENQGEAAISSFNSNLNMWVNFSFIYSFLHSFNKF